MKKIFNWLLMATLAITYTSCKNEVDDIFDASSAVRIQNALKDYNTTLQSPANGWRMEYYGGLEYGGYTMFAKFNSDNTVTVSNEIYGPQAAETSHYKLEQSAGVVLSFDEYNNIFHFFSDPDNLLGVGDKGKGMLGDLEFRMQTVTADSIVMTGKKHGSRIVMTPAPADWDSYLNEVITAEKDMAFSSYFLIVGTDTATVTSSYRQFTFSYNDDNGVLKEVNVPYIINPDGMHFYKPLDIFGKTITDLTYQGGNDYLFTTNADGAVMKGHVVPLSQAITQGYWFICYNNMSPGVKAYWDYAAPGHLATEGEIITYCYLSGANLYIQSGNFMSAFGMGAEALSGTQISYAIKTYAGTSTQQNNAKYYWASRGDDGVYYFRYFIQPLTGTFDLTADDERNPSMIKLTNTANPNMYFIVTKQQYPATAGMQ